jgi:hypothetical protein
MPGKDFAVEINKLGAMPVVIESFAKIRLGKLDLAESPYTISGTPQHVNIGLFVRYRYGLRLPFGEDSILAKSPEERGGRLPSA